MRFTVVFLPLLAALFLASGARAGEEDAATGMPAVLIIHNGESARAVADEISLAIGDLVRTDIAVESGQLAGPLADRIAWMEAEVEHRGGIAALWIESSGSWGALVHFLTNDSGVMTLRTLGSIDGAVMDEDLALLVRETIALTAALSHRGEGHREVTEAPDDAPLLLLLDLGAGSGEEERLREKVGGAARVKRIRMESGFSGMGMRRQLERLGELFVLNGAFAATWVERDRSGSATVYVAAPGSGAPVIRARRLERIPGGGEDDTQWDVAFRMLADRFELVSPSAAADSGDGEPTMVRVSLQGSIAGGLYGGSGESLLGGGGLSLDLGSDRGVFVRVSIMAAVGSNMDRRDERVSSWELEPSIGIGYAWPIGRTRVDLFAAVATPRTSAELEAGDGRPHEYTWWRPRWVAGLDLFFPLSSRASLMARGEIYGSPTNDVFERESDGSVIWATPFVSWRLSLGVSFGTANR